MIWPMRARPVVLAATAWTVGAATAIAVGLLALSFVGTSFLSGPTDPLARAADGQAAEPSRDPDAATAVTPPASAATTPTATAPATTERQLGSSGGFVVAQCTGENAYLAYWSPAQGFHVGDVVRGPARTVQVEFEGSNVEVKLIVTCVGGVPEAVTHDDPRDG